jgi:hypothetical protein
MRNNEKIRKIERLFEGGDVDLFEILHFLIEEFENYKVLEFRSNEGRSNEGYLIKFYRKGDDLNFFDLIDSEGVKLIQNYKFKHFFEIMNLRKVKKLELMEKKFSINHIVE